MFDDTEVVNSRRDLKDRECNVKRKRTKRQTMANNQYTLNKRLPGIMRTDDFPLRLHTAQGTSL
jgi:hypothetical protein